jgi:ribosomal peptide maturation radical SAM protein 1
MKDILLARRAKVDRFLSDLIAKYKLDDFQIVGFSSMFTQNGASFAMARKLKDLNPEVITVVGGANCETTMGKAIAENVLSMDFVFSGPALVSFPKLARHCIDGEMEKCSSINGVFSRRDRAPSLSRLKILGSCETTRELGDELDINTYIELDYDNFLDSLERSFPGKEVEPILTFETSRGCWWGERAHCTFCGLNGDTLPYRAMAPELAIKLINSLFRYSPRCRHLDCVDNILPKNYVKEVLPYLNTPPGSCIFYEVKADLSDADLQVLSRAGVKIVQPGVESLATSTLKLMRKGTSSFQNLTLLMNCVMYDIMPLWNLLVGFPGEEAEVYKRYIHYLPLFMHLPPPYGVFPVRFDRFSPYFVKAKEYKLDLRQVDYYEMIYPFSEEALADIAYYFADRNLKAEYLVTMVRWIDQVRQKYDLWKARWLSADGKLPPKLFLRADGQRGLVYDSRSGDAIEHHLSEFGVQLLRYLSKPRRISDLSTLASKISGCDPQQELMFLQERGLVFEENARYMSLAHLREPLPMTFKTGA